MEFQIVNNAITALIAQEFRDMLLVPERDANSVSVGFLGVRADWKARREIHALRRHYGCTWLCDRCWASKGRGEHFSYKNFSVHAPWRDFYDNETRSPWYDVPGAHWQLFVYDLMHVLYLGCCVA